jgi:environmental stress-induced protein Ves
MMRHLTPADYRRMPWANGRGVTVERMRVEKPGGGLLWRLSMASVTEDGPFSLFPGVERNLTVIMGPGFRLLGEGIALNCLALVPVAFPGDVPVMAVGTDGAQSDDFNVMTARELPRPEVTVEHDGAELPPGGTLCLFALGDVRAGGVDLSRHDLLLTEQGARIEGRWPVIAVRIRLC